MPENGVPDPLILFQSVTLQMPLPRGVHCNYIFKSWAYLKWILSCKSLMRFNKQFYSNIK